MVDSLDAPAAQNSLLSKLADLLMDCGYRAVVEENSVRTGVGGMTVSAYPFDNATIQLITGVKMSEDWNRDYKLINDHNYKYRYSKMFIDNDGDVSLSGDFFVDLEKEGSGDHLVKAMEIFESSLSLMKETLRSIPD